MPIFGTRPLEREHVAILDDEQFTRPDLLAIAEISDGALKGMLDRGQLGEHSPGRGKRRLFTGADILKAVIVVGLSRLGYPLDSAGIVGDIVVRHAGDRLVGRVGNHGLIIANYPSPDGKGWTLVPLWRDQKSPPEIPPFVHLVNADGVIDKTLQRLRELIEEPTPPPASTRDLFVWVSEKCIVGLTEHETEEILQRASAGGNPWRSPRYRFLFEKYHKAAVALAAEQALKAAAPDVEAAKPAKGETRN